jgi:S1-C subfamily serine protease
MRAARRVGVLAAWCVIAAATVVAAPSSEAQAADAVGTAGLVVVAIDPGSPAERAGLARGDVLLKADKIQLRQSADLGFYVSRLTVGEMVSLELTRGEERRTLNVELGSRDGRPYLGVTVEGERGWGLGLRPGTGPDLAPGTVPGFRFRMTPDMAGLGMQAEITEVVDGSPASTAGIQVGDTIVALDGEKLAMGHSLQGALSAHAPGDSVALDLLRADGGTETLQVRLGAAPEDASRPYLGVRYRILPVLSEDMMQGITPSSGYYVREVAAGSPAERAGIVEGNVITAVAGRRAQILRPLSDLISLHTPGETVEIGLIDGENERTVSVTLDVHPDEPGRAYLGVVAGGVMGRMRDVPNDEERGRNWLRVPAPNRGRLAPPSLRVAA